MNRKCNAIDLADGMFLILFTLKLIGNEPVASWSWFWIVTLPIAVAVIVSYANGLSSKENK